jgi:hypothetical protein
VDEEPVSHIIEHVTGIIHLPFDHCEYGSLRDKHLTDLDESGERRRKGMRLHEDAFPLVNRQDGKETYNHTLEEIALKGVVQQVNTEYKALAVELLLRLLDVVTISTVVVRRRAAIALYHA